MAARTLRSASRFGARTPFGVEIRMPCPIMLATRRLTVSLGIPVILAIARRDMGTTIPVGSGSRAGSPVLCVPRLKAR